MKGTPIDIRIQGKDLDLTPAIKKYVIKKFSKLNKYINPSDTSVIADVEVGKTTNAHQTGDIYRAEINLQLSGSYLRAESEKDDIYAAIDETQSDIIRELSKTKGKKETLYRKGARLFKRSLTRFGR